MPSSEKTLEIFNLPVKDPSTYPPWGEPLIAPQTHATKAASPPSPLSLSQHLASKSPHLTFSLSSTLHKIPFLPPPYILSFTHLTLPSNTTIFPSNTSHTQVSDASFNTHFQTYLFMEFPLTTLHKIPFFPVLFLFCLSTDALFLRPPSFLPPLPCLFLFQSLSQNA